MESHLRKTGDWRGTAMIQDSGTWAVFGYMRGDGDFLEVWTEPVLAWIMAERRHALNELATVFYGLTLRITERRDAYESPEACENLHDERGCHIGYSKKSLVDLDAQECKEAARQHMLLCQRRREAIDRRT